MNIDVRIYHKVDGGIGRFNGRTGRCTTERAESSYGIPVLVIDGRAYGPGDIEGRIRLFTNFEMLHDVAPGAHRVQEVQGAYIALLQAGWEIAAEIAAQTNQKPE